MSIIPKLLKHLHNVNHIYIQTHDYPDHDAIAAAFALQYILKHSNISSHLIYEGDIQRDSLKEMIRVIGIEIKHNQHHSLQMEDNIIVVDGCVGNKNVSDLTGNEICVIDHHEVKEPDSVSFCDIRSEYGACSTIIYTYFKELNIEIPRNIATALMIGINIDTSLLTRGVSLNDIEAYSDLYKIADITCHNSLLRNFIQTKDLRFYKYLIEHVIIEEKIARCYFPKGCNQNLMGILGDFLLALEEVEFVILYAKNNMKINFSIRNENENWNAAEIIQKSLKGIGFGGGHFDMAGGIINDINLFDENIIVSLFQQALQLK